jgi:hypothetical protein
MAVSGQLNWASSATARNSSGPRIEEHRALAEVVYAEHIRGDGRAPPVTLAPCDVDAYPHLRRTNCAAICEVMSSIVTIVIRDETGRAVKAWMHLYRLVTSPLGTFAGRRLALPYQAAVGVKVAGKDSRPRMIEVCFQRSVSFGTASSTSGIRLSRTSTAVRAITSAISGAPTGHA